MKNLIYLAISIVLISCASAGKTIRDPKEIWSKALVQCANNSNLKNSKLLFLGLSNNYGPGSVWRIPEQKVYEPRWGLDEAIADVNKRASFINKGVEMPCSANISIQSNAEVHAFLEAVLNSLTANAGVDASKSLALNATFIKWRQDNLRELPYEAWIKSPESSTYGKDITIKSTINSDSRRVMKTAIWVEGFKVDLKFSSNYLDSLNAISNLRGKEIDVAGGFKVTRTTGDELSISSPNGFYIVGTFVALKDGGFGMEGNQQSLLDNKEVDILSNSIVKKTK